VTVENARLFVEAQGKAALEERQKLARELHDSVSQALYGIALGARTARELLDRDPPRAAGPLDYVASLAEAGLAEMRALIFELRPESLAAEGLIAALSKQSASLRARHGITVRAELCEEPDVPLHVKEALYRIAQEALHNIVRHARASEVTLTLYVEADDERPTTNDQRPTTIREVTAARASAADARPSFPSGTPSSFVVRRSSLVLEIQDNGVGFEAGGAFPGHLGLRSMRERAASLGGTLEVESASGAGARITARIPR
jgi:signal transduction histidine kinase